MGLMGILLLRYDLSFLFGLEVWFWVSEGGRGSRIGGGGIRANVWCLIRGGGSLM